MRKRELEKRKKSKILKPGFIQEKIKKVKKNDKEEKSSKKKREKKKTPKKLKIISEIETKNDNIKTELESQTEGFQIYSVQEWLRMG